MKAACSLITLRCIGNHHLIAMNKIHRNIHGFSFAEVIVVLAILAIASFLIIGRTDDSATNLRMQTEVLKNHLRHAQALAMVGADSADVFGIKCDTNFYWLFKGINPDANITRLFDSEQYDTGNNDKLSLSAKKITISAPFAVYFDNRGIPYDATSNMPLASDLAIAVGGAASPITITQHTGFIP